MSVLNLIRRQRNHLKNRPNHGIFFGIETIQLTFEGMRYTEVLRNKARLIASICLLAIVCVTSNAEAKKGELRKIQKPQAVSKLSDLILTKRQQEQVDGIQSFLQSMKPTLMPVLRKSKMFPQMQADMKRMAASKDDDKRMKQIVEYQSNYREVYGAAWEKAGFKRSSVLEQLRRLAPDMNVQMVQDYGFKITPMRPVEGKSRQTITAAPLRSTEITRITDFELTEKLESIFETTLSAGISIAKRDMVEVSMAVLPPGLAVVGIAGGSAEMRKILDIPLDSKIRSLHLRGKGKVASFAIGLGGAGGAFMNTKMIVSKVNPIYLESDDNYTAEVLSMRLSSQSIAPIAWVMFENINNQALDQQVELQPGKRYIIEIRATGAVLAAFIGASGGSATIADVNVELSTIH